MKKFSIIKDLSYTKQVSQETDPKSGIEYLSVHQSKADGWCFNLPNGNQVVLPANVAFVLHGVNNQD